MCPLIAYLCSALSFKKAVDQFEGVRRSSVRHAYAFCFLDFCCPVFDCNTLSFGQNEHWCTSVPSEFLVHLGGETFLWVQIGDIAGVILDPIRALSQAHLLTMDFASLEPSNFVTNRPAHAHSMAKQACRTSLGFQHFEFEFTDA